MEDCAGRRRWAGVRTWAAGLALGLGMVGCSDKTKETPATTKIPVSASQGGAGNPAPVLDPHLHQSFADATLTEPPQSAQKPPDMTIGGKSTGKLYTQVVSLWDSIHFTAPSGKSLDYHATLETQMGAVEIALRPDLAPNHVRSFLALAKAGYYDGLVFERTVHEEGQDARLELIEGGCPLGTGDLGYGSIGYWLKPEYDPKAVHEEGTVGASHEDDEDAASCKFYITLAPAPFMNGHYTVFGKVTQGLDVARKILSLPVRNDAPEADRPIAPVVINKVTIQTTEVENPAPN